MIVSEIAVQGKNIVGIEFVRLLDQTSIYKERKERLEVSWRCPTWGTCNLNKSSGSSQEQNANERAGLKAAGVFRNNHETVGASEGDQIS